MSDETIELLEAIAENNYEQNTSMIIENGVVVELGGIPIPEEADVKAFRLPDGNVHLAYYPDGFPDDETFEQHMRDNYPRFYN